MILVETSNQVTGIRSLNEHFSKNVHSSLANSFAFRFLLSSFVLSPDFVLYQFGHEVDEDLRLSVFELSDWNFSKDVTELPCATKIDASFWCTFQLNFCDDLIMPLRPIDFVNLDNFIRLFQVVEFFK